MKTVLSILLVLFVIVVTAHRASSSINGVKKRYYDAWESNNDGNTNRNDESVGYFQHHQTGFKKDDPCANKPLWYLKYQARLGKLSPFYDCLHGQIGPWTLRRSKIRICHFFFHILRKLNKDNKKTFRPKKKNPKRNKTVWLTQTSQSDIRNQSKFTIRRKITPRRRFKRMACCSYYWFF